MLEDLACRIQYVGSTTYICSRWSSTKSSCNKGDSNSTGLYKHFMDGCHNDTGAEKAHIRLTLLDNFDTSVDKLQKRTPVPMYRVWKIVNKRGLSCAKLRRSWG